MNTHVHSGDLGDIIWYLPVVKYYANKTGVPQDFLIQAAAKGNRTLLNARTGKVIESLLQAQPYIGDVGYCPDQTPCDYDGAKFRDVLANGMRYLKHNLCIWNLLTHGVPVDYIQTPWLFVPCKPEARILFSKTARYPNTYFPWNRLVRKYAKVGAFVGTGDEHAEFVRMHGYLPHLQTPTLLDLACAIEGCELLICNQSCPHAIAEALLKRIVLAVCPESPDCCFNRPEVFNIRNNIDLDFNLLP